MNTLAPLYIVLAMLIVMNLGLLQSLSTAQNAGNTLVLGLSGFMPLKKGKAGSPEHKPEDGAS
jgi:hypothetical protein